MRKSGRVISEWRIISGTRERILSVKLQDIMTEGVKIIKSVSDR